MGIVTFAVEAGSSRAVSFDVIEVRDGCAFLVDLSADWNGYRSVADAAEPVFGYCRAVYGAERIVCRDSVQGWVAIASAAGETEVKPLGGDVPVWIELKSWFAGSGGMPVGGGF